MYLLSGPGHSGWQDRNRVVAVGGSIFYKSVRFADVLQSLSTTKLDELKAFFLVTGYSNF